MPGQGLSFHVSPQRPNETDLTTIRAEETNGQLLRCLEGLRQLRVPNLEPVQFWPQYIEALRAACDAEGGVLVVHGLQQSADWQEIAFVPASQRSSALAQRIRAQLPAAAEACKREESVILEDGDARICAVRVQTGTDDQRCLALLCLGDADAERARNGVAALRLLSDLPVNYQLYRATAGEISRSEQFTGVLDLLAVINGQSRFLSAAMTLCNELAARHRCEHVSLGWLQDGYVRVQAISHLDDFDKKMEAVQVMERAMEEAFDQDADIAYPAEDGQFVSRDHEMLAKGKQLDAVCSLPLRVGQEVVAVCTLERQGETFGEAELRLLRLCCDQTVRRLDDLKCQDRWFGAKLASFVREQLAALIGFEHTWAKGLAVLGSVALALFCFLPVDYRLEAPVILRTEDVTYLTVPYDGYIAEVRARVGDEVAAGDTLLAMDRRDLFLEEAALAAERNRYQRELEKARADQALADTRISAALLDQAAARLDRVRHRLSQAVILAPTAATVVEGDQMERVGSPVSQGDILFRLGRIDEIYAELEAPESEIQHVKAAMDGEISLASRPGETFRIQVVRTEPSAVAREEGSVFLVRCELPEGHASWWRPGMTGVAKLNAGEHSLLWIFTHRTVDFLRLNLWW